MASVYPRKGSRFWWIRYRDANGKRKAISSGIDKRLPGSKSLAKAEAAKHLADEALVPRVNEKEAWAAWAGVYMEERYKGTGSHRNATVALRDLLTYFAENGIRTPRMVNYQNAAGFIPWRIGKKPGRGLPRITLNTARLRFLYFRILMAEAVRRKFASFNVCRDVAVRGERPKEKLEITEDDEKKIESALKTAPEWMQDQWLVMMRQGCRIAETRCPLPQIDTQRMTITFRVKGGRFHTAALHHDLLPIVYKARAQGRLLLIEGSPNDAARWCDFFKALKLPYSSHCCRVTVITRLLRESHSAALVSAFIGHTEEINRIYRRLKPADSKALLTTLEASPSPLSHSVPPGSSPPF